MTPAVASTAAARNAAFIPSPVTERLTELPTDTG
jgi:hypothetical protein